MSAAPDPIEIVEDPDYEEDDEDEDTDPEVGEPGRAPGDLPR